MFITLYNYQDKPTRVEIPDSTPYISGKIISGDMVLYDPFFKDSSNDRLEDYDDGNFYIPKEKFHILNTLEGENLSYKVKYI